jgi:pimeloyl-ACP methyl ester carboxylesterase
MNLDVADGGAGRRGGDVDGGIIGVLPEIWPRTGSGLEIRGGGAISVDTGTLHRTAAQFVDAKSELDAIAGRLGSLQNMLVVTRDYAGDALSSTSALSARLLEARLEAERIAAALREAAVAYELVELNIEHRTAVLAGDGMGAAAADARMEVLRERHPDAWSMALESEFERTVMWPSELVRQSTETGVAVGSEFGDPAAVVAGAAAGILTLGAASALGVSGTGRLSREDRLAGPAGPVALIAVAPARVQGAPTSLAAVTQRMPGAGDSRIRVERYVMPGGARQFAVYIAGTQSLAFGGDDPWDNASNAQLYTGRTSDSYAATQQALAAAGVEPGDVVHAFGHSQGAMIAAHLALEGGYDARTLVSFGSPVEADVGSATLSVTLRHTDDPVAALAGGGHAAAVGAPGSFVVERVADSDAGAGDLAVPAHRMVQYAETAALVDASADPRVDGLRDVFSQLAGAESVTVTEFSATRAGAVSPSSWAGG